MKKNILIILLFAFQWQLANAFCGFYVAKADAGLFNKKSQVILVRDGQRTVVTMSNDFTGNVNDFAMVVPVPEILLEKNIRVVDRSLFDKLDSYSAPRMAEYFDSNPCMIYREKDRSLSFNLSGNADMAMFLDSNEIEQEEYSVKIEAEYSIEEYDVVILSAKESNGLQRWLEDNGYQIPATAEEVLEPYIKNDMKFFVVKVNLEKLPISQQGYLRPLQIEFNSDQFMLPIRLGMANAKGDQDMMVYTFTRTGRVEASNYRTVKLPTDRNIPKFVKDKNEFGEFYFDLFENAYQREARKAVFLEYAWNVSPSQGQKCDPCVGPPPVFQEFATAGVDWAKDLSTNSNVFFTRLHVRYSREKFPQDLLFQVTPNKEHYQCRYVVRNPPQNADFTCGAGQEYLKDLKRKRQNEVDELAALTGWESPRYDRYINEYSDQIKEKIEVNKSGIVELPVSNKGLGVLLILSGVGLFYRMIRRKRRDEVILT